MSKTYNFMIIGMLLAISVSVSLVSLMIILTGATGALKENIVTGATIGTSGAISYAKLEIFLYDLNILCGALYLIKKDRLEEGGCTQGDLIQKPIPGKK